MEELNIKLDSKENVDAAEEKLVENKKITEEEVERSLNFNALSEEEQKAIEDFNSKVNISDTNVILTYGSSAQKKISDLLYLVRRLRVGDV